MHYYKRNLGDYAKKAGRLSMLQHGSYTLLIDACYDREQFPTIDEAIEWTWASTTEEIEAVTFVLRKFFVLRDGVYVQTRIEQELAEYHSKSETNKRIAKERETNRAENRTKRTPVVDVPHNSGDEPPPNHKPLTINQEPIGRDKEKKMAAAFAALTFPDFWQQYPKKSGKADAEKSWNKIPLTDGLVKEIHAGLSCAKLTRQWTDEQGKFIPNAATWLNGKRWEDEGTEAQAQGDAFAGLL